MIQLKIDDKVYSFDRNEMEKMLVAGGIDKLEQFADDMGMAKTIVKGAITTIFGMIGIHKPAEMDTIEFAGRLILKTVLDGIEKMEEPFELHPVEVK